MPRLLDSRRALCRRPRRAFASEWIDGGTEKLEARFLASLFRVNTPPPPGSMPGTQPGVWGSLNGGGWIFNDAPDVEFVEFPGSMVHEDLVTSPGGPPAWAETYVQFANEISDGGASSPTVGAPNIMVDVNLLAHMEASGPAYPFWAGNATQFINAAGFQTYSVTDATGDPQVLDGSIAITYSPPPNIGGGGVINVGPPAGNTDGIIFRSSFVTVGVQNGRFWVQRGTEPKVDADLNAVTGAQTLKVDFSDVRANEFVSYNMAIVVSQTGVVAPAGTIGYYNGGGEFNLNYQVNVD